MFDRQVSHNDTYRGTKGVYVCLLFIIIFFVGQNLNSSLTHPMSYPFLRLPLARVKHNEMYGFVIFVL